MSRTPQAGDQYFDQHDIHAFNATILERYARLETTTLACIVSENYIFELLILHASLSRAWSFHPWRLVAFSTDAAVVARIRDFNLPCLEGRLLGGVSTDPKWVHQCVLRVELVEHGGLEQAIITDLDNLFMTETPEITLYLKHYDCVFIGAPHSEQILQASFWGFRRTEASIAFARLWAELSEGRHRADAGGLPFALAQQQDERLKLLVLAKPKPAGAPHHPCPYDVQVNVRPIALIRDAMGCRDRHMGRAKVIHFGGIRCKANGSVAERMAYLAEHFHECLPVFDYYLDCANEAAGILGLKTVDEPEAFLADLARTLEAKAKPKRLNWLQRMSRR